MHEVVVEFINQLLEQEMVVMSGDIFIHSREQFDKVRKLPMEPAEISINGVQLLPQLGLEPKYVVLLARAFPEKAFDDLSFGFPIGIGDSD
ncbi:MAG: hypothetical protein O6837_16260 [Deltaproteobacteria bacterium]|nr:hypothetical protein [Deltaproteobacteria bacterium]MCZ6549652.1 hypothetical protein [Deltaproteobacteria bacterium]